MAKSTAGAAGHATCAGPAGLRAGFAWHLRAVFIRGEFAIAVLFELLESVGGVGEFVGFDRAILVGIERGDDG